MSGPGVTLGEPAISVSPDPSRNPRYLQNIRCNPWDPQVFAFPHSAALKSLTRPTGITLKAEISHRLKISDTAPRKSRILTELSHEPQIMQSWWPRSHRPDFLGLLLLLLLSRFSRVQLCATP